MRRIEAEYMNDVQNKIGYYFRDYKLLEIALGQGRKIRPKEQESEKDDHPSVIGWKLEYIGDALVKQVIAILMLRGMKIKAYQISFINSNAWMSGCAELIGIRGPRESDKLEAVVGAIFADCDSFQTVYDVVFRILNLDRFEDTSEVKPKSE